MPVRKVSAKEMLGGKCIVMPAKLFHKRLKEMTKPEDDSCPDEGTKRE